MANAGPCAKAKILAPVAAMANPASAQRVGPKRSTERPAKGKERPAATKNVPARRPICGWVSFITALRSGAAAPIAAAAIIIKEGTQTTTARSRITRHVGGSEGADGAGLG